ncbi:hypothetical protein ACSDR0_35140 [Streptosporangium sp. G11]|uniref:hypothetical protein n=1 Tax=Streptosporangium sp. G11 TaxID=3436926 RepID=UPI003EBCC740
MSVSPVEERDRKSFARRGTGTGGRAGAGSRVHAMPPATRFRGPLDVTAPPTARASDGVAEEAPRSR